jgi:hypothetical protein
MLDVGCWAFSSVIPICVHLCPSVVSVVIGCCQLQAGEAGTPILRDQPPRIYPDYAGIVLPPNIAPLNFRVEEPGTHYRVEIRPSSGESIVIASRSSTIQIPLKAWSTLLRAHAGEPLYWDISVQDAAKGWMRFQTITNQISREGVDDHLVYRLLKPLYNAYIHLGVYQRDLQTFEQRPVLENDKFGGDCLNCHTFLNHNPNRFALNIRSSNKLHPMLLTESNSVARVDKTMGYLSWHPSGRLLAFSANKLSLFGHTRDETRDVYDAKSDLGIFRVDSNTVVYPPAISTTNWNETWPEWSPDGRYLYFSRAAPLPIERYRQIKYDIVRVSYDIDRDVWGEPEMMVSAQETGLSACQPKVSPDGRLLVFCLCKWGNFPVYQVSSDLYCLDLTLNPQPSTLSFPPRPSPLSAINSDQAESWHCWSSNGRWLVFSSKRLDGLFARPFFSYVDAQGQFHKPFLLPQQDPAFYESCLKTFNVPQLVDGPIVVKEHDLAQAILRPQKILSPKAAGEQMPPVQPPTPAPEAQSKFGNMRE